METSEDYTSKLWQCLQDHHPNDRSTEETDGDGRLSLVLVLGV